MLHEDEMRGGGAKCSFLVQPLRIFEKELYDERSYFLIGDAQTSGSGRLEWHQAVDHLGSGPSLG